MKYNLFPAIALALFACLPLRPPAAQALAPSPVATPRKLSASDLTLRAGDNNSDSPVPMLPRVMVTNPTSHEEPFLVFLEGRVTVRSPKIRLAPGASTVVTLPIPVTDSYYYYYETLYIADNSGEKTEICDFRTHYSSNDDVAAIYRTASVSGEALNSHLSAIAERIGKATEGAKGAETNAVPLPGHLAHVKSVPTKFPFTTTADTADPWPDDDRAYAPFAGVCMAASEWVGVPDASRQALLDYVALGGNLFFFGSPELPAGIVAPAFAPEKATSPVLGFAGVAIRSGLGTIAAIPGDGRTAPSIDGVSADFLFLELARAVSSMQGKGIDTPFLSTSVLPRPSAKVAPLFWSLLAFSLAAGPLALFVLARMDRRIQLLWVFPALSFLFAAAAAIAAISTYGVHPSLSRRATAWIDQRHGRALTFGAVEILTPMSLHGGIRFHRASQVIARNSDRDGRILVDSHLDFAGSWTRPRDKATFLTKRAGTTALRLEIAQEAPGRPPVVTNALGAKISGLVLWDGTGFPWTIPELGAGESATLRPAEPEAASQALAAVRQTTDSGLPYAPRTGTVPRNLYFAKLPEDCPFLDNPLSATLAAHYAAATVAGVF